jgi:predicted bacteriocin transport accessory protein
MADKKTTKKKPAKTVKREPTVKPQEKVEVKVAEGTTEILNKILLCLYAIIVILVVNTTILLLKDVKVGSNTSESESETEYDTSMFTSITTDTLEEAVSGDNVQVVYIGRSTCGFCVKFLPTLQQAQKDYNYTTLYLDITTVTTTEQQNKIFAFDNEEGFISDNFGATPMVLIMKDGKLIDGWLGYDEYSAFASWLEENGFTKE